jgi:hypothetical protein
LGETVAAQDALGYLHTSLYDAVGRMSGSQDPLGYLSTTIYDSTGRAVASMDADELDASGAQSCGVLTGFRSSEAAGISNTGRIVGTCERYDVKKGVIFGLGFVWYKGRLKALPAPLRGDRT